MRLTIFVLASISIALPMTALADETKTDQPEQKMICKGKRDLAFGSHRRAKPVCKTEAEWKLLEKGTQRELQSFKDRAQTHGDAIGR